MLACDLVLLAESANVVRRQEEDLAAVSVLAIHEHVRYMKLGLLIDRRV